MIGDRIKQARLSLGYSAEQVAEFLGTSPATIYRYENGDISKLPSKFIKPLAEYLCVSPSWLMGWSEIPENELNLRMFSEDPAEKKLIAVYRGLSPRGQQLLMDRAEELKVLYGKKSEGFPDLPVQVK